MSLVACEEHEEVFRTGTSRSEAGFCVNEVMILLGFAEIRCFVHLVLLFLFTLLFFLYCLILTQKQQFFEGSVDFSFHDVWPF